MTDWIEVAGTRYEQVTFDHLTSLQAFQVARELGVSLGKLETYMIARATADADEPAAEDPVLEWAATAVLIWAARLAAGEKHPTVASAQAPLSSIDFGSDDPDPEPVEEPPVDPTAAASDPAAVLGQGTPLR